MTQEKIPQEPWNLWETPELLKVSKVLRVVSELDNPPKCIYWKSSFLALGTEELFCRKSQWVWGSLSPYLPFRDPAPWLWQRSTHRDIYGGFFKENSNCPAWIAIIPYRVPSIDRFLGASVISKEISYRQRFNGNFRERGRDKISIGSDLSITPGRTLLAPELVTRSEPPILAQGCRVRSLIVPGKKEPLWSIDYPSFVELPYISESQLKFLDNVSAMLPYLASIGTAPPYSRIFTTVTIILASLDIGSVVEQVLITIRSSDGRTVVITPGRRLLEVYCHQYQDEHRLLKKAIRLGHGSKKEEG